jgi:hypothetical protein
VNTPQTAPAGSWSRLPFIYKYLIVAASVVGTCFALAYIGLTIYRVPDVLVESEALSPNHEWVAIVRSELYGSIGGSVDFAISLRPLTGFFQSWREDRVFEIYTNGFDPPPTVRWLDTHNLVVELHQKAEDIPLRRSSYRDIVITYRY